MPPTAIEPTPPPTPTASPAWTPRPRTPTPVVDCDAHPAACARLRVGSVSGAPGERIEVAVTLDAGRWLVAGVGADLALLDVAPVAANADGTPACRVDPAIAKPDTRFAFQPFGCSQDCTSVRALVLSLRDAAPIASGSRLFVCELQIVDDAAAASYPLALSFAAVADLRGNEVPVVAVAGALTVHAAGDHASVDGTAPGASGCQIDPTAGTGCAVPLAALALQLLRRSRRRRPPHRA